MQKWEYAYIVLISGNTKNVTLVYLHPAGEKTLTLEKGKKGGFFKEGDYWGQVKVWIVGLGQEGYELTSVTATDYAGTSVNEYWFKRPIQ